MDHIPNLTGRVVIITGRLEEPACIDGGQGLTNPFQFAGGNTGIGKETVQYSYNLNEGLPSPPLI